MNRMRECTDGEMNWTTRKTTLRQGRRPNRGARICISALCALTAFLGIRATSADAQSLQPFPNSRDFIRAEAVQAANQPALLATPGVRGVGINGSGEDISLLVLVDSTNTAARLPTSLDGLPVHTMVVGQFNALQCSGNNPQNSYPLPVPLGVSGGNDLLFGGCCASGTIGFKVRDNASGEIGWISNNHVVGHGVDGCPSTAPVGTPEYQAGPVDVPICGRGQLVGTLARTVPIDFAGGDNVVDAGYVQSSDAEISANILNIGPQVNNVVPAFIGQFVRKNGRTTDCTEGIVAGINMSILVDYNEPSPCQTTCGTAIFTNQILIQPTIATNAFVLSGDSGSPVVDVNNNAVGLVFAADSIGESVAANPIGAVLSALNVSLTTTASTQVVTRNSRFWFTHGYSSATNCVNLFNGIRANGSVMNLGFVILPTGSRNADSVIDAYDTLIEALSFYWRSTGATGEAGGTQSAKLKGSALCKARKQLAVELIAATANAALFGSFPGNATYSIGGTKTKTNFPPDLITQAQLTGAGFDLVAIRSMTILLKKFNSSGMTNGLPHGFADCGAQTSKTLKQISKDPTLQSTCPGVNNSCTAAQVVVFPNGTNAFAQAAFATSVSLSTYTNNMPTRIPICPSGGGRDAVWEITPDVAVNGRQFTVSTAGSNFDTMLSVWKGDCGSGGSNLVEQSCTAANLGLQGVQTSFTADGTNNYFIVAEGPAGQYGKLKIKITSP